MIGKKDVIAGFLVGCCVMALLFAVMPTKSVNDPNYSPWTDLNDDGVVDSTDLGMLGTAWGSFGDPITKAGLLYDSGWLDINDKAGQYFSVTHNLDSMDLMIDITGKTTADGGIHQKYLGGTDFVAGWNKTYGGENNDYAGAMVQTSDGGYAIAGCTNSFGTGGDCWLVKTDASGNMEWNKTYGGTESEGAIALVQTSDGGYAIAGNTNSFGAGGYDQYLVKTDALGNMQWNKTYGGGSDDYAGAMVQTGDGGYALAGCTYSFGADDGDFYLAKTDAAGNMQWNKTYGGENNDVAPAMVQASDGGYALAGYTYSFGAGDCNQYLVKTDASGNIEWNQTYGGTDDDWARALVQTRDGGYALAGDTWSFGPSRDFYLVKTDASGNMQWNKTYGGTSTDIAYSMVQTRDRGYAMTGYTNSFGAGYDDFYLVKTDTSGNMAWNKTYGGTESEGAIALVQTSDGGYELAGYTQSYGSGGDCYLVKTDAAGNALDGFKYGLAWVDSTANSITLYRGTDDAYWNYVRVRVWQTKP